MISTADVFYVSESNENSDDLDQTIAAGTEVISYQILVIVLTLSDFKGTFKYISFMLGRYMQK